MFRVWYKTFFVFFFLFIMLLNMLYFFNVTGIFPSVGMASVDYSNKYFGFGTIIKFFSEGFTDSTFFNNYNKFLNDFTTNIRNNITGGWITLSDTGGVTDIFSGIMVIVNFFRSIFGILQVCVYFVMLLVYILMLIGWTLWRLMLLFNGMYWSVVPTSPYATLILG